MATNGLPLSEAALRRRRRQRRRAAACETQAGGGSPGGGGSDGCPAGAWPAEHLLGHVAVALRCLAVALELQAKEFKGDAEVQHVEHASLLSEVRTNAEGMQVVEQFYVGDDAEYGEKVSDLEDDLYMAEGSMHSTKGDCRVAASGRDLSGMESGREHLDGGPAELTFVGKDGPRIST